MTLPEKLEILIITLSDRASLGEYEDKSGPAISEALTNCFRDTQFSIVIERKIIPDEVSQLENLVSSGSNSYNLIFTTGGTGIGPRDITVDVISPMLKKEIPGIMELIRTKYGMDKPNALLSRGVVGIIGKSLIFTLPGSLKAVNEYMMEICKILEHSIYMQYGVDVHH